MHIDLLPDLDAAAWLFDHKYSASLLPNLLAQHLPRRFAQVWSETIVHGQSAGPINQYSERIEADCCAIAQLASYSRWYRRLQEGGSHARRRGYPGIIVQDMEAKKVPGLYFIGEVVDVTGHLGGFNFQWAWASGYAAGQFV